MALRPGRMKELVESGQLGHLLSYTRLSGDEQQAVVDAVGRYYCRRIKRKSR